MTLIIQCFIIQIFGFQTEKNCLADITTTPPKIILMYLFETDLYRNSKGLNSISFDEMAVGLSQMSNMHLTKQFLIKH